MAGLEPPWVPPSPTRSTCLHMAPKRSGCSVGDTKAPSVQLPHSTGAERGGTLRDPTACLPCRPVGPGHGPSSSHGCRSFLGQGTAAHTQPEGHAWKSQSDFFPFCVSRPPFLLPAAGSVPWPHATSQRALLPRVSAGCLCFRQHVRYGFDFLPNLSSRRACP